jgi:hypothetical protein
MNVYEINGYWIAAKNADEAFGLFLEKSNYLDDVFIDDLEEGESKDIIITVRRLTQNEIRSSKSVTCCEDGCELCEGKGDYIYLSYQELIDKQTSFPCVIAKEI